jgi:hypothetical protein
VALTRADIERGLDEVTRPFLAHVTALHAAHGGVTEIRIIRRGVIWATRIGPDDVDRLVEALRPVGDAPRAVIPGHDHPRSGEANVYFTLNPVRPDPAWPTGGAIRRTKDAAKNDDILAYLWLLVDLDPERDPKDRSATDAEKAEALAVAEAVAAELASHGVATVRGDSGNGFHVIARHAAPSAEGAKDGAKAMRELLRRLDGRFSTPGAKVDKSTHNPGRIMKLYGTVATKGDDTEAAPHRLSWLDVGAIPAPMDAFVALAEPAPAPKAKARQGRPAASSPTPRESAEDAAWRTAALAALDLGAVYGEWLTGNVTGEGWRECRDPDSPSGDQHPSAGVADGVPGFERGVFYTFRESKGQDVFAFLVARGRARNFWEARRLVAQLSGVPLPGPAPADAGVLDDFAGRWATAATDDDRSALLEAAVRAALSLSTVASANAMERIRAETGLAPGVLRSVVARAKQAARKEARREATARPEPPKKGLTVIEFVTDADTIESLFDSIIAAILPLQRFFRHGKDLVYVQKGVGPLRLDDKNLPGVLSSYLELAFMHEGEEGREFDKYDVLSQPHARALLASPRVTCRLPVLSSYVRSPVFDKEWNFVAAFGFHPASGIFYDGPPVVPRSGDAALRAAVNDFKWKDEVDRVNFVGALLTGLTMPHWPYGHPFLAINGNKPGVGKGTLANVLALVTDGDVPSSITLTANDEEFEKQIATRIEAGDRVIVIDNAKSVGAIGSAALERTITAPRINFRRLGSNTAITRPENDVLFALTMNVTQLGADLRRRALPVNLCVTGNVRTLAYANDDLLRQVAATRLDILAELAGMVRSWLDADRPLPVAPARHSTDQRWAATVDGILQHAGLEGFLTNMGESEHAFNENYDTMAEVCALHHGDGAHTAGEWAGVLFAGPLAHRANDRRGNPRSKKSRETIVGMLFAEFAGDTVATDAGSFVVHEEFPRKGHPPIYSFVPAE